MSQQGKKSLCDIVIFNLIFTLIKKKTLKKINIKNVFKVYSLYRNTYMDFSGLSPGYPLTLEPPLVTMIAFSSE